MPDKFVIPRFSSETEEAEWWDSHQDLVTEKFVEAAAAGKLGHGRAAAQALESCPSATTVIHIPEDDIARARRIAEKKGIGYEAYLRALIHARLERDEPHAD